MPPPSTAPSHDFASQIDGLWAAAKLTAGKLATRDKPKRCHYMPQFLQRRWAQNGVLRVRDSNGVEADYPIRDDVGEKLFLPFGYEEDLYTTLDGGKHDRETLEALFGALEDSTHTTLKALKRNNWKMADKHRRALSLFVAAAFLRLPNSITAAEATLQEELDAKAIKGTQVHGNTVHALMGVPFKAIAQGLYSDCRWTIVRYDPPQRQTTGDIFLRKADHEGQAPRDESKLENLELQMPLDPQALLVLNGWKSDTEPFPSGECDGGSPLPWQASKASHWFL